MSRAHITSKIQALGGRLFSGGFEYPPASESSAAAYGRIRRLYGELQALSADWAIATLGEDGWTIGTDRYTKEVAEEQALTLRACDCQAIAVRVDQ